LGHCGSHVVLDNPAFVHETAFLYGRVYIGPGASIWPYVVMRAEVHEIRIGSHSNIQDFVMIHVGNLTPTIIGESCSITHHATLHGCTIGDRCLIGINATVMDGAKIGPNSIVAGHSIVGEGKEYPANSIIAGVPAKLVAVRDDARANLANAELYHISAKNYASGIDVLSSDQLSVLTKGP